MKGALVSFTRSMAVSYAHRVRVNCICPGTLIVERNQSLWDAHPDMLEQSKASTLTRGGRPSDIAECAVYLASTAGEFVSGAILPIDGGISGVNDDRKDYRFYETLARFPDLVEDEPPLYLLCTDYDRYVGLN